MLEQSRCKVLNVSNHSNSLWIEPLIEVVPKQQSINYLNKELAEYIFNSSLLQKGQKLELKDVRERSF